MHWLAGMLGLSFALDQMGARNYEFVTHAAITQSSFSRFLAEKPGILDRLGLWDKDNVFGRSYFYLFGDTAVLREAR